MCKQYWEWNSPDTDHFISFLWTQHHSQSSSLIPLFQPAFFSPQLFLIGLPFQKLSWEYGEPADKNNPDCMPCLFLSYPAEEGGQKVTKMLQVFSKEVN